jgi:regulator-associated protein of mTOR
MTAIAFGESSFLLSVSPNELTHSISIWDWKYRAKMNKFSNTNVAGSSISSIHFINEMASSLMLTASSESNYAASVSELTSP